MISRYGMGESVGLMSVPEADWPGVQTVSQESAAAIEREGCSRCWTGCTGRSAADRGQPRPPGGPGGSLSDRETLDGDEVRQILGA